MRADHSPVLRQLVAGGLRGTDCPGEVRLPAGSGGREVGPSGRAWCCLERAPERLGEEAVREPGVRESARVCHAEKRDHPEGK